jgi:hypothetical protein
MMKRPFSPCHVSSSRYALGIHIESVPLGPPPSNQPPRKIRKWEYE